MKKAFARTLLTAFLLLLLLSSFVTVSAQSDSFVPYTSYEYNTYDESIPAPVGYVPYMTIDGSSLGLEEPLSDPRDIYYDGKDTVYVLDSGNKRVLLFDTDFKLKQILDEFLDEEGVFPLDFTEAEGLTVAADGSIVIADTLNERILICNSDCTLRKIITKPESAMQDDSLPFDVSKVMYDSNGRLYAIAKSANQGAFVFDKNGQFEKFFGGNEVVKTSEVIANYFLRRIMTPEQMRARKQATPVTLSNFDIDSRGFIYTSTLQSDTQTIRAGAIRKLNSLGKNILKNDIIFGDLEWDRQPAERSVITSFCDVSVDDSGFLSLLDKGRGRVFQYAQEGEMIAVFGGHGDQFGNFDNPVALETIGDRVYVVDAGKNCIYGFKPTPYAEKYRTALAELRLDDFEDSLEDWQSLLSDNTNNAQAFYGIGRIYDLKGDYKKAMEYFELAGDRTAYSTAYREYRNVMAKEWFLPILAAIILGITGVIILFKTIKKRKAVQVQTGAYSKIESKYTFPLYTLFHPMDGFYQVKTRKIGSVGLAAGIIVSAYFLFTFRFFFTGYIFNLNRPIDYNVLINLLQTIGLAGLFIVANWAVCTLLEGSGSLKEITVVTAYSLIPALAAVAINVILSNFLVQSESAFLSMIIVVGISWSVLLLLCGLLCVHEYSMMKTIVSVFITLLGMAIIVLLIVMFLSLLQQTVGFATSIFTEISLK